MLQTLLCSQSWFFSLQFRLLLLGMPSHMAYVRACVHACPRLCVGEGGGRLGWYAFACVSPSAILLPDGERKMDIAILARVISLTSATLLHFCLRWLFRCPMIHCCNMRTGQADSNFSSCLTSYTAGFQRSPRCYSSNVDALTVLRKP